MVGRSPMMNSRAARCFSTMPKAVWARPRRNSVTGPSPVFWILFDNHKFTSYFATLRFLVGIQKSGEGPVTEFLRGRAQTAFGIVEKHLAERQFIIGDRPTIADISMVGYLYYTEETGLDRAPYPNIIGWAKRIAALPGWAPPYDLMR